MLGAQVPIRILLVEDDELEASNFEQVLLKTGLNYSFRTASSAQEGLNLIEKQDFDCIFLDYFLPDSNGINLLKEIRSKAVSTSIAVLTSQEDEKVGVEMMKLGAFDYFPKSEISKEKLNAVLRHVIRVSEIDGAKRVAESALHENERLLDIVFNATHVGICLTNDNGIFVRVNKAFSDILGWPIDELIGYHFSLLFKQEFQAAARQLHQLFMRDLSGVVPDEWVLKRKDKQKITLSVSNSLYTDDSGQKFVVSVLSDISDKKKTEEELLEAKKAAELAAKAKTEFLSNMSHEIRTPMNAVIGLTELLLQEKHDEKTLEYLKSIKYSADNLLVIINDVLDFSKIESGKITLEVIDFDIRKLVDDLGKTISYKADEKGIELLKKIADDVPRLLRGDPFRLNQILLNLTGNAIKFTEKGFVEIAIRLGKTPSNDKVSLIIDVIDTGIGIPERKLGNIFESFTQAYTDTTRLFGGTGLGLAITQNLVRLQGGQIQVKSELGKGSVFKVTMDFETGQRSGINIEGQRIPMEEKNLKGMRILVVEDNKMNQFVARQILQRWNAQVSLAGNGEIALEILEGADFDLVFMDLQMPVMGGFETTDLLRSGERAPRNQHVPIMALTADAFAETRQKVASYGMNDFVTKPFDQDELYQKIIRLAMPI